MAVVLYQQALLAIDCTALEWVTLTPGLRHSILLFTHNWRHAHGQSSFALRR
jgi:hypothetical protein